MHNERSCSNTRSCVVSRGCRCWRSGVASDRCSRPLPSCPTRGRSSGSSRRRSCVRARARLSPSTQLLGGLFLPKRFDPASFDLVAGSHLLEHVGEPVQFLEGVRSITRPGGWVFLEVPRETEAEVARIVSARHEGLMHLLFFEREPLLATLRAAGWQPLAIAAFGPSRDSFSVVPPPPPEPPRRSWLRRRAGCVARRFGVTPPRRSRPATSSNRVSVEAFSTSLDPDGIWLRVLAQNPDR